jgi:formylglycine-generating enzyme required for sulfatase activity
MPPIDASRPDATGVLSTLSSPFALLVPLACLIAVCSCGRRAVPGVYGGDGDVDIEDGGGLAASERRPEDHRGLFDAATLPPFAKLADGSFYMGSPPDEPCRLTNETLHKVVLDHSFEIGITEVTQGQFLALTGHSPSSFSSCGSSCPVDSVSWSDAAAYCNFLSKKAGLSTCYSCTSKSGGYDYPYDCMVATKYDTSAKKIYDCPGYRLPLEAEWEYAARGGTDTAFSNGPIKDCTSDPLLGLIGWYSKNSGGTPHPVGQKSPNATGLLDMAGNLWEWTNDIYEANLGTADAVDPVGPSSGDGRVIRGGAFTAGAASSRAASRNKVAPSKHFSFIGFRCARTLMP